MKTVKVSLSVGFAGVFREDILEFEDGTTAEEIDEGVKEWANNYIDLWHEEVEENES